MIIAAHIKRILEGLKISSRVLRHDINSGAKNGDDTTDFQGEIGSINRVAMMVHKPMLDVEEIFSVNMPPVPTIAWQILQLVPAHEKALNMDTGQEIRTVIERVAQFNTVSHVAVKSNKNSSRFIQDIWMHALYSASYARSLAPLVHGGGMDNDTAYLCGLFHNFGMLLLADWFEPEYALLQKWLQLYPRMDVAILEQRLLGMGRALQIFQLGHARLGELLLRSWSLPEVICVVAREHHNVHYVGPGEGYVRLVRLCDQMLRADGIGDGEHGGVRQPLLDQLGLDIIDVRRIEEQIKANDAGLQRLVENIV